MVGSETAAPPKPALSPHQGHEAPTSGGEQPHITQLGGLRLALGGSHLGPRPGGQGGQAGKAPVEDAAVQVPIQCPQLFVAPPHPPCPALGENPGVRDGKTPEKTQESTTQAPPLTWQVTWMTKRGSSSPGASSPCSSDSCGETPPHHHHEPGGPRRPGVGNPGIWDKVGGGLTWMFPKSTAS